MVDNENQIVPHIPKEEKTEGEMQQFLVIQIGKEMYGIPIEKTKEVARPLQITHIPGTPAHIMGLMSLHGEILCVVDVKTLLNLGEAILSENSKIVVVRTREGPVGIYCDEVTGIYDIAKKDREPALPTLSSEMSDCIKEQVQTRNGLMGILDIERLLLRQEK